MLIKSRYAASELKKKHLNVTNIKTSHAEVKTLQQLRLEG